MEDIEFDDNDNILDMEVHKLRIDLSRAIACQRVQDEYDSSERPDNDLHAASNRRLKKDEEVRRREVRNMRSLITINRTRIEQSLLEETGSTTFDGLAKRVEQESKYCRNVGRSVLPSIAKCFFPPIPAPPNLLPDHDELQEVMNMDEDWEVFSDEED